MQYRIKKLDGRYSHKKYFKYCVEFDRSQWGPLHFNVALKWMIETYGFTAEIREWQHIRNHHHQRRAYNLTGDQLPDIVNNTWSWTNDVVCLRIYIKGDKELSFFKLKWPNEGK